MNLSDDQNLHAYQIYQALLKLDQEYLASLLQPSILCPTEKMSKHIQKRIKQLINSTTCLYIPHSVQSHPFRQAIDAVFSLYGLPIVFLWTQQHLFHRWKLYKEPIEDGICIWQSETHTLKQKVYICLLM